MAENIKFLKKVFKLRSLKELLFRGGELLFGYPLWLFSFLVPRFKNKWVFGTNVGFIDNAKYLFIYANEQDDDVNPIWISDKADVVDRIRTLGFKAYKKYTLKGIFHSLTASTYIFTYHSKDINFFTSGNAKKINLWHGVGIKGGTGGKKTGGISSNKNILSRIMLPHLFEKNTLFLSTSPLMNEHFRKMFSLDPKTIYEGIYPRCYYMCKGNEYLEKFIEKYEDTKTQDTLNLFKRFDKVYLYMPTWRGNLTDNFIEEAGFNFKKLNEVLRANNSLFVFKLHPAVRVLSNISENQSNICFLDKEMDIYPILDFTDVLITDYSSIYYDYLLLKDKDILLYPFDIEDYLENSNDLAFDYNEYTPGKQVYNMTDLLCVLNEKDVNLQFEERNDIINLFWGQSNINDLSDFYNKIKSL